MIKLIYGTSNSNSQFYSVKYNWLLRFELFIAPVYKCAFKSWIAERVPVVTNLLLIIKNRKFFLVGKSIQSKWTEPAELFLTNEQQASNLSLFESLKKFNYIKRDRLLIFIKPNRRLSLRKTI